MDQQWSTLISVSSGSRPTLVPRPLWNPGRSMGCHVLSSRLSTSWCTKKLPCQLDISRRNIGVLVVNIKAICVLYANHGAGIFTYTFGWLFIDFYGKCWCAYPSTMVRIWGRYHRPSFTSCLCDVRKGSQQPCHQCLCLRRLLAKPFDHAHDGQWWNQNSMIWVQILVYHWFWYRICWPEYIYIYTYGGMRTWFLLWTEYTVVCTDWGFVGHPISCCWPKIKEW